MQRKPFLSIEDILDIKPSPVRHCCKYSSICHTESRQPSTVDFTDDYLQPSRCSWDRPSFVPWHSTACYAGYNAPFPKRNPYLQQYYVAYGTYASQLYLRGHYSKQQRKRMRASFTHEQVLKLQKVFQKKKYLGNNERTELAQKLNMTEQQIKIWFQNRRYKEKRQQKCEENPSSSYTAMRDLQPALVNNQPIDAEFDSFTGSEVDECIEIV